MSHAGSPHDAASICLVNVLPIILSKDQVCVLFEGELQLESNWVILISISIETKIEIQPLNLQ